MMETLKSQLKRMEGLSLTPYRCPAGYWSLGFGHRMPDGGISISHQVAGLILDEDIDKATFEYLSLGWELGPVRKNVVIHMIFWMGMRGFLRFKKCIAAIEKEDWQEAADEMLDSQAGRNYTTRMTELADLMRDG